MADGQPELQKMTQSGRQILDDGLQPAPQAYKVLNDAQLILNRRINFNRKARKGLQLMCEDKVSKYKLEEVHCSLPSSVKATFIMTFSPDGQKVASTHGDHRIYICDLNTGKLLDTLEGHPKTPWCLAWHPCNREILASGCLAGEVRVWDLKSKACESWTSENNTIITSLDFHPRERVLVIATSNDIHFWDWSESDPFAKTTTTHDKEKVKFVGFDPSGTKLITGISNLPKFTGYSNDSLQNRIIDSYLTHGALDPLSTENMTQSSEITNPLGTNINSNETFNERNSSSLSFNRQSLPSTINNDVNYGSTVALSRIAFLYRQLEALEDSLRHTSFSPYINHRPINSSIDPSIRSLGSQPTLERNLQSDKSISQPSTNQNDQLDREARPTQQETSQSKTDHAAQPNSPQSSRAPSRTPNTLEPFVVSFDESLEHLQLSPLIVDGQTINLATIIEQYPIDIPYQLHYVMQFESINQVNQNFIRISKLMSSIRLYRQIVQQIISSDSGQGHFQPNQILTAQSASSRSSRHTSNLPIVLRNFPVGNTLESNSLIRGTRSTDPIMAIQFRNSARNVPLVAICKIDLLSARAFCIMQSQLLIEQAMSSWRPSSIEQTTAGETNESQGVRLENLNRASYSSEQSTNSLESNNINSNPSFYSLLYQLHQSLNFIIHAPLTTSNVHTHICSLRNIVNKLLVTLSSTFQTQEEGPRLIALIHDIAHSLTGRSWNIPLGATLDDIRLDVIHTLCIVDLSLHLARQVQLLQMQRFSAMARIEESRRTTTSNNRDFNRTSDNSNVNTNERHPGVVGPSTSRQGSQDVSVNKRKDTAPSIDESAKRRKVERDNVDTNSDNRMIEESLLRSTTLQPTVDTVPDRVVVWSSPNSPPIDPSIQRLLVDTASGVRNISILMRIYHRLHLPTNNAVLTTNTNAAGSERPIHESRRRALSQDNSVTSGTQEANSSLNLEHGRSRQTGQAPNGLTAAQNMAFDTWQRHPHLHVYQTRGSGQHLWFNQWTIPLPVGIQNSNYRLQCWNFSLSTIPNIKDSQINVVTQKCRIHNDASIDVSGNGSLVACLVPREDIGTACLPSFDLKIFSLRTDDFGTCYYQLPHGPNAISVSLSPSARYAVVGLASNKFISGDPSDDDLPIAKVFKLNGKNSFGYVRDIKIKRDDSTLSLNAIRWMSRGIVYNVGPQHHQRYQTARMRSRGFA